MTALAGWENFYVIVGSSAGALIGLQFVVMALIANLPRTPGQAQAGHAFATPNIVHFETVLFLAAALCAPWLRIGAAALCWGLAGLVGASYALIVVRRLRAQHVYQLTPKWSSIRPCSMRVGLSSVCREALAARRTARLEPLSFEAVAAR